MKRYVFLLLLLPGLVLARGAICLAQDIRDNQTKSLDLNSIRILDLKTVAAIEP